VGPYVWGRYDILCLPPSFPYGGMENPCLTFVTPTLLAGDKSLADVVAHEIAHSWSGNLVGCINWEHFWLNEGCLNAVLTLFRRCFDALLTPF
jgi:leukotriene-A4 hydrolase